MTTHRSVHLVSTASLAAGLTLVLLLTVGLAQIPVAPVEALPGSLWSDALRGGTVTTAAADTVTLTLPAYSGTILVQTTP